MVLEQPIIGYLMFSNIPEGNYSGSNLVTAIPDLLNALDGNFAFEVIYNPARGTVNIEEQSEGILMHSLYQVILE